MRQRAAAASATDTSTANQQIGTAIAAQYPVPSTNCLVCCCQCHHYLFIILIPATIFSPTSLICQYLLVLNSMLYGQVEVLELVLQVRTTFAPLKQGKIRPESSG